MALSYSVYQDPGHPRSTVRHNVGGQQMAPQIAGQGARLFSRQSLVVLKDKWDFIIRTRFPKITCYEKYYEFITATPWKFGDRTPLAKKRPQRVLFII